MCEYVIFKGIFFQYNKELVFQFEFYIDVDFGDSFSDIQIYVFDFKLKVFILDIIYVIDVVYQLMQVGICLLDEWMWNKQLRYSMKLVCK